MERKESIGKDATSKETLEDLEKNEKSVSDKSDEANLPSPDGAFDEDSRNAQGHVDLRISARLLRDPAHFAEVRRQPMHLPIAGNQLLQRHSKIPTFGAALAGAP